MDGSFLESRNCLNCHYYKRFCLLPICNFYRNILIVLSLLTCIQAGAYEHTNGRHKRNIPQGQVTRQLANMPASYSIHDGEPGHSSTQRPQTTKQGHRGQSRTVGRWKRHNSGGKCRQLAVCLFSLFEKILLKDICSVYCAV